MSLRAPEGQHVKLHISVVFASPQTFKSLKGIFIDRHVLIRITVKDKACCQLVTILH